MYKVKIIKPIYDELVFSGKLIGRHDLPVVDTKEFPASVKVTSYSRINVSNSISTDNKPFVQSFGDVATYILTITNSGSRASTALSGTFIQPDGFTLVG
jgi:uncharacterized repeat protein (TIGR01451 family)